MAPFQDESGSSDEEGAPEAVSLSLSKQHVQKQDEQLNKARLALKEKKKTENREKDRKLKERAEKTRGKQREDDLEARMARAMQEAEEEMGDRSGSEEDSGEEFGGIASERDSEASDESDEDMEEEDGSGNEDGSDFRGFGDADEDMGSEEEESVNDDEQQGHKPKANPNHLPDELFAAAFASQSSNVALKNKGKESKREKAKKRKRSTAGPKDVIIGSRAVRTLQTTTRPVTPSTLPSRKVKKFLDRTLALKGGNSKARGWERRPANIGVLRHNGPATSFVRNR